MVYPAGMKILRHKSVPVEDRLKSHLVRRGECLVFIGPYNKQGYAKIRDGKRKRYAHNLAYELWVGPIPDGKKICHTCDNPPCCEPGHLFAGTQLENVRDCISKDRNARGERCHRAKLTAEQVLQIRDLGKTELHADIGIKFGIDPSAITKIVRRKRWAHLKG